MKNNISTTYINTTKRAGYVRGIQIPNNATEKTKIITKEFYRIKIAI